MDNKIAKEKARWEEQTLAPVLKRFPERQERFETSSGTELERLYLPEDIDYAAQLGFSGRVSLYAGCAAHYVPWALMDDASVRGICFGG